MKKIKEFFNEEGKFNVKDVLVLTIIVVFYSILSFINLGTTSNPNTFFERRLNMHIRYLQVNILISYNHLYVLTIIHHHRNRN